MSAEPANAGTITGGGVYPAGNNVTAEASADPGYVFLNWTENGTPVSTSAIYNFSSAASRVLVANFITRPELSCGGSAPGSITVSWPAGAVGWVLQESPDLSAGSWTNSTRSVTVVGNQKQITVSPFTGKCFFRLSHP